MQITVDNLILIKHHELKNENYHRRVSCFILSLPIFPEKDLLAQPHIDQKATG